MPTVRGNPPRKRGFTRKPSKDELNGPLTREETEDEAVNKYVYEESSEGSECPSWEDENGSHQED
jgi:hypothetical protein